MNEPHFQPAFFSYSRKDEDFVFKLARDFRNGGADIWIDQLNILPGQRWAEAIESALEKYPFFVVILSKWSASSPNVSNEVTWALEEGKTVIPVVIADCQIPLGLRGIQFIDFRSDYESARSHLLESLGGAKVVKQQDITPRRKRRLLPGAAPWAVSGLMLFTVVAVLLNHNNNPRASPPNRAEARIHNEVVGQTQSQHALAPEKHDTAVPDAPRRALTASQPLKNQQTPPQPFAVGDGVILTFDSAQGQWRIVADDKPSLRSICFATHNLGWAVGDNGIILRTTDGGATWTPQDSPVHESLSSVACSAHNGAWAAGENGEILHVSGQTQNWIEQNSRTKNALHAISFTDDQSGWAVGLFGVVLHTENGGNHWVAQSIGLFSGKKVLGSFVSSSLVSVVAESPQSCWVLDVVGAVWHSTDGGNNWTQVNALNVTRQFNALTLSPAESLWAVGSHMIRSNDGGGKWETENEPLTAGATLQSVVFSNAKSGWAVGAKGLILHTQTGGSLWTPEPAPTRANLTSIAVRP